LYIQAWTSTGVILGENIGETEFQIKGMGLTRNDGAKNITETSANANILTYFKWVMLC